MAVDMKTIFSCDLCDKTSDWDGVWYQSLPDCWRYYYLGETTKQAKGDRDVKRFLVCDDCRLDGDPKLTTNKKVFRKLWQRVTKPGSGE